MFVPDGRESNPRQQRGLEIANKAEQIEQVNDKTYRVHSQGGVEWYLVVRLPNTSWKCTCPDFKHRSSKCKHIWAIEFRLTLRREVQAQTRSIVKIEPLVVSDCKWCGSKNIVKDGIRHNKSGDIQLYFCRTCCRYFSLNIGFEKMRSSPQIITTTMQLYFTGESLRNCRNFLKLQGVNVSHVAVYKWIRKYIRLMQKYLDRITPKVSDTWRADELFVKFKGNMKYVFALMDDETRFWLAHEVADSKQTHDARQLFRNGQSLAGKKPRVLITDGLESYNHAVRKEWYAHRREDKTYHIRQVSFQGIPHNNKMERLNGEIRDREKVMRGLKKVETPILPGYRIYHNFVRPHSALNGGTPADACGISVEGDNKWITLFQNATKSSKTDAENREGTNVSS